MRTPSVETFTRQNVEIGDNAASLEEKFTTACLIQLFQKKL